MIKIDEHYSIDKDTYNWILRYEKKSIVEKDGEEKEVTSRDQWYFGYIEGCLERYVDCRMKEATTMPHALAMVDILINKIKEVKSIINE
jgi:hypothetical protein